MPVSPLFFARRCRRRDSLRARLASCQRGRERARALSKNVAPLSLLLMGSSPPSLPADPVFTRRHPDVHAGPAACRRGGEEEGAQGGKRSLLSAEKKSRLEADLNRLSFILSNSNLRFFLKPFAKRSEEKHPPQMQTPPLLSSVSRLKTLKVSNRAATLQFSLPLNVDVWRKTRHRPFVCCLVYRAVSWAVPHFP